MLHYDASSSDPGAVAWLVRDPRCRVSYNWLVLDDGNDVEVAPAEARAWHAGVCRSSDARLPYADANSAFYGLAVAARAGEVVTDKQYAAVVRRVVRLYGVNRWPLEETFRIVGHASEAFPRGRKVDPAGPDACRPVLNVDEVRRALALFR